MKVEYTDPTSRRRHERHPGHSRPRRRRLHHRRGRRPRRYQRLHRVPRRTRRADGPDGDGQRGDANRPRLDRPGETTAAASSTGYQILYSDDGGTTWERAGRRHPVHRHHVFGHHPLRRRNAGTTGSRAINSIGTGATSNVANATTVSGPGLGTVTSGMITQTSAVITVTIANPDTSSRTVNLQYKRNADTAWTGVNSKSTVSDPVNLPPERAGREHGLRRAGLAGQRLRLGSQDRRLQDFADGAGPRPRRWQSTSPLTARSA